MPNEQLLVWKVCEMQSCMNVIILYVGNSVAFFISSDSWHYFFMKINVYGWLYYMCWHGRHSLSAVFYYLFVTELYIALILAVMEECIINKN
jgi:hypothetical protein